VTKKLPGGFDAQRGAGKMPTPPCRALLAEQFVEIVVDGTDNNAGGFRLWEPGCE
jgi:hypothetical protein